MITRRKKPLNPSKNRNINPHKPQFKPKQSLPPLDLLTDFEFVQKQNIKFADIQFKDLFHDLYPYFRWYSITTCLIIIIICQFSWDEYHYSEYNKYFEQYQGKISKFWQQLTVFFLYINFLLIIGCYLEATYRFWYVFSFFISYFVGILTLLLKHRSTQYVMGSSHLFTGTYSIYCLILVEKKMGLISPFDLWIKIRKFRFWKYFSKMGGNEQNVIQNDLIDLSYTQRPLSIQGGQTEDSFSYDSFFAYIQPLELSETDKSNRHRYFESNISKRSSFITTTPLAQFKQKSSPFPSSYFNKFNSQKSILSTTGQIQSTIQSDNLGSQKKQEQIQLIKIYKCIIMAFFVYIGVSKVEWITYVVSVCCIMGFVEIMTNQKLKILKFSCFAVLGSMVFCLL